MAENPQAVTVNGVDTGHTPETLGETIAQVSCRARGLAVTLRGLAQTPAEQVEGVHVERLVLESAVAIQSLATSERTILAIDRVSTALRDLVFLVGREASNDRDQRERHQESHLARFDALAERLRCSGTFDDETRFEPVQMDGLDEPPMRTPVVVGKIVGRFVPTGGDVPTPSPVMPSDRIASILFANLKNTRMESLLRSAIPMMQHAHACRAVAKPESAEQWIEAAQDVVRQHGPESVVGRTPAAEADRLGTQHAADVFHAAACVAASDPTSSYHRAALEHLKRLFETMLDAFDSANARQHYVDTMTQASTESRSGGAL